MELIGKKVIVRSNMAGVFFGTLKKVENNIVELDNFRKIYYWRGANTIEDIAEKGILDVNNSKLTVTNKHGLIGDVCQILKCTEESVLNLESHPIWTR